MGGKFSFPLFENFSNFPSLTFTFNPTPESSEIAGPGISSVRPGSISISSGARSPNLALAELWFSNNKADNSKGSKSEKKRTMSDFNSFFKFIKFLISSFLLP